MGVSGRLLPLSSALLRPHVECGVQFWAPRDSICTDRVERGPQRATKRRKGLEQLSYEERLSELGLFSPGRRRRRRGDLSKLFSGSAIGLCLALPEGLHRRGPRQLFCH